MQRGRCTEYTYTTYRVRKRRGTLSTPLVKGKTRDEQRMNDASGRKTANIKKQKKTLKERPRSSTVGQSIFRSHRFAVDELEETKSERRIEK